jgi:hypothetical protein
VETSPLPVNGCKIWAYARRSGPLSREGSLSCHTCCDTGPRFFRSHQKDRPSQSPLTTHMRMWRTYSNPDPHGAVTCKTLRTKQQKLRLSTAPTLQSSGTMFNYILGIDVSSVQKHVYSIRMRFEN